MRDRGAVSVSHRQVVAHRVRPYKKQRRKKVAPSSRRIETPRQETALVSPAEAHPILVGAHSVRDERRVGTAPSGCRAQSALP